MMGARSTNSMVALPRHRRRSLQLLAAALALGIQALPLRAQAQGAVAYPSPETLRDVQLAALACARENTSDTCSQARKLADPLMDHPRLPGGCKDTLWAIIRCDRRSRRPAAAGVPQFRKAGDRQNRDCEAPEGALLL